jgi:hypothetical protein
LLSLEDTPIYRETTDFRFNGNLERSETMNVLPLKATHKELETSEYLSSMGFAT